MSLFSQFPIMYTFKERINYCKVSEVGIDQRSYWLFYFAYHKHTQKKSYPLLFLIQFLLKNRTILNRNFYKDFAWINVLRTRKTQISRRQIFADLLKKGKIRKSKSTCKFISIEISLLKVHSYGFNLKGHRQNNSILESVTDTFKNCVISNLVAINLTLTRELKVQWNMKLEV